MANYRAVLETGENIESEMAFGGGKAGVGGEVINQLKVKTGERFDRLIRFEENWTQGQDTSQVS